MSTPSPTLTLEEACGSLWDLLVVGAGPSGSVAARQLAIARSSVLLVDKASFPRRKVCGCYLNGAALETLEQIGLDDIPRTSGAPVVSAIRLGTKGRVVDLPLPPGRALSREVFDTALVRSAVDAGADFLPGTQAKQLHPSEAHHNVTLVSGARRATVRARIVIAADGVGGQLLRHGEGVRYHTRPRSLVGVGTVTNSVPATFRRQTIHMAVGKAGYVGALQMEQGRLDIAAALDPTHLGRRSPGEVTEEITETSGLPFPPLRSLTWLGTPSLSRKPSAVADHRLFVVGDAAGYVEPFTGEGISWALATGRAVAPFVRLAVAEYDPQLGQEWCAQHRRLLGRRQWLCHLITRSLRRPWLAQTMVTALRAVPGLAKPLVSRMNRAPHGI